MERFSFFPWLMSLLLSTSALADTTSQVIDDNTLIIEHVLCQKLPSSVDSQKAISIYSDYINQVSNLFGDNADDITNHVFGVNKDTQMHYILRKPIAIVGITFDAVNINRVKSIEGNYYQIEASKVLTDEDKEKLQNVPKQDNLMVLTTKDKMLKIMCNVKIPLETN